MQSRQGSGEEGAFREGVRKVDTSEQTGTEASKAMILGTSSMAAGGRRVVGMSERRETGAPVYQGSLCPPLREECCGFQDPQ